jgi:hypothetical protein
MHQRYQFALIPGGGMRESCSPRRLKYSAPSADPKNSIWRAHKPSLPGRELSSALMIASESFLREPLIELGAGLLAPDSCGLDDSVNPPKCRRVTQSVDGLCIEGMPGFCGEKTERGKQQRR